MNFFKFLIKILALAMFVLLVMSGLGMSLPAFFDGIPFIQSIFGWFQGLWANNSWGTLLSIALGTLGIGAPGALETVAEMAGGAAGVVAGAIVDTVGGALSAVASSPIFWIGGGLLLLFLLSNRDDSQPRVTYVEGGANG